MRRAAVIVVLVAFLLVSALLARHLSFEGRERDAVLAVVRAQPLAVPGDDVQLLRVDSETAYSLGPARGPTRVAWRLARADRTYVQCADVQRTGSVLSARRIIVHRLSGPVGLEASC